MNQVARALIKPVAYHVLQAGVRINCNHQTLLFDESHVDNHILLIIQAK